MKHRTLENLRSRHYEIETVKEELINRRKWKDTQPNLYRELHETDEQVIEMLTRYQQILDTVARAESLIDQNNFKPDVQIADEILKEEVTEIFK